MLANVLSLLQGPCFHFIFINNPCVSVICVSVVCVSVICVSVICVSVICTSPSLLAFYFRFTVPAFVLYLLHHLSIRFILASLPLDSFILHHSCRRFSYCFTISVFVLFLFYHHNSRVKDRTEIWLCLIKYEIWKARNKHIVPAVLGSLKRQWGWHLLMAPYNLRGSWLIHVPQNSLSWRDVSDICPTLQNSIRFRHVFAGLPTQSRR